MFPLVTGARLVIPAVAVAVFVSFDSKPFAAVVVSVASWSVV